MAQDVSRPEEKNGASLLLEVLRAEGVRHVFGNPGTTEMPLMQALGRFPELQYVLGLQETTVVAMADGYAQATRRPAFVNLHTAGGLGHAMGALLHAKIARTPLVITAGQQDTRHSFAEPLLYGDLLKLAEPAVKWAREISHPDQVPVLLRRAFQDSATAPRGPTFLALPIDVMERPVDIVLGERSRVLNQTVPTGLEDLASRLSSFAPGKLAIVAGNDVARDDAVPELTALAELLGATMFGPSWPGLMSFPTAHPLWAGNLPTKASEMRVVMGGYHAVLLLGGHSFISYLYSEGPAVPADTLLFQLSEDPSDLGHTYPTALACVGSLKPSMKALHTHLRERGAITEDAAGALRLAAVAARHQRLLELDRRVTEELEQPAISAFLAAGEVLRAIADDIAVVDEAPVAMPHIRRFLERAAFKKYFFMRSAILGWGLPAAVGVSLGLGGAPVVALLGDGSSLYSPQGLWTAAHLDLPVTLVVFNKSEYNILKRYASSQGYDPSQLPGMNIDNPFIDFGALASAMGLTSRKVSSPRHIAHAVEAGIASGKPNLVEIVVTVE